MGIINSIISYPLILIIKIAIFLNLITVFISSNLTKCIKYIKPIKLSFNLFDSSLSLDIHCNSCKRPIIINISKNIVETNSKINRFKYAYTYLLYGADPAYFIGALVLSYSLKKRACLLPDGNEIKICVMHTPDVPLEFLNILKFVVDDFVKVDYIEATSSLFPISRDFNKHKNRFRYVFTKLHLFKLNYDKVLMLDIDTLCVNGKIQNIFKDISAPAAMFRGGRQPSHGGSNGNESFKWYGPGWWYMGGGINAGVMLFEPNEETFNVMMDEIRAKDHPEHVYEGNNGPEQDYLSRYFCGDWSHLDNSYNFQLHQLFHFVFDHFNEDDNTSPWNSTRTEDVSLVHYSAEDKPWDYVIESILNQSKFQLSVEDFINLYLIRLRGYRMAIGLEEPISKMRRNVDSSLLDRAIKLTSIFTEKWLEEFKEVYDLYLINDFDSLLHLTKKYCGKCGIEIVHKIDILNTPETTPSTTPTSEDRKNSLKDIRAKHQPQTYNMCLECLEMPVIDEDSDNDSDNETNFNRIVDVKNRLPRLGKSPITMIGQYRFSTGQLKKNRVIYTCQVDTIFNTGFAIDAEFQCQFLENSRNSQINLQQNLFTVYGHSSVIPSETEGLSKFKRILKVDLLRILPSITSDHNIKYLLVISLLNSQYEMQIDLEGITMDNIWWNMAISIDFKNERVLLRLNGNDDSILSPMELKDGIQLFKKTNELDICSIYCGDYVPAENVLCSNMRLWSSDSDFMNILFNGIDDESVEEIPFYEQI